MALPKPKLGFTPDLTFDRWTGVLHCWSTGQSWQSKSGKDHRPQFPNLPVNWEHGKWGRRSTDPLPAGLYFTDKKKLLVARSRRYNKEGFTDKKGFFWFIHIVRVDDILNTRSQFGIHPDGKAPGTAGCIGLTDPDTEPIYEALKKLIQSRNEIYLSVTGKDWDDLHPKIVV